MLRRRPAATATARANQLTATVTGTISSGTDYLGAFFPSPPTNLAGKTYTIVYEMDDAAGTASYGTWPSCSNGKTNFGLSNPVVGSFTQRYVTRHERWFLVVVESIG